MEIKRRMTLPKNETGIVTVTHKRYSVFRIFLLTSYLVGLRQGFTSIPKEVLNVLLGASPQFPEISAPHLLTVVILPEGVDVISGNQPSSLSSSQAVAQTEIPLSGH